MMGANFPSRLLILACSATKRDGQTYMPAIERYDGPLWRTLRTVDPDGKLAKIAFLSAHFGFRSADTPIEMYDSRMTREVAAAIKAGGLGMRWPRPKTQRRLMPSGEHAGIPVRQRVPASVVRSISTARGGRFGIKIPAPGPMSSRLTGRSAPDCAGSAARSTCIDPAWRSRMPTFRRRPITANSIFGPTSVKACAGCNPTGW